VQEFWGGELGAPNRAEVPLTYRILDLHRVAVQQGDSSIRVNQDVAFVEVAHDNTSGVETIDS
jgi:hypothetical protein